MARRTTRLPTILLGATLILAALLAWLAARAATAQRRSTATALQNYADIAAWQYTRAGRSGLSLALTASQGMIIREFLRPMPGGPAGMFALVVPAALPGPELLRRVLGAEPCECLSSKGAPTVFRIMPDRSTTADGRPLTADQGARLAEHAYGDSATWGRRATRILPPGTPGLFARDTFVVLHRIRLPSAAARRREVARPNERPGVPVPLEPISVVYGMVVTDTPLTKVLRTAMSDAQVLAPSLMARLKDSSLVRIVVESPDGETVFDSHPRLPTPSTQHPAPNTRSFVAHDTIGTFAGSLRVTATLDQAAAAAALFSASRGPSGTAIAVLLGLTIALGAGALLLMRREQQLMRLREDFVAGVSHELRTPITQIRLHGELLLQEGFRSDAERQRALGVIHREALRMTNLVENVLQFGRAGTAGQGRGRQGTAGTLSLGAVAREVAESFTPLAVEVDATLAVDVRDDAAVAVDRDALTQILNNLVENALKYGPQNQTVSIQVRGSTLAVQDEGPGIPAAERAKVFEPYYRLERDRNAPRGGSGLGLAVVADLVRSLGGRCRVEAAAGGGARVVVELPEARA